MIATVAAAMALVVAIHLGLVGAGRWHGDEYYHLAVIRDHGWSYIGRRLIGWSPRPFSEACLYLYSRAVEAFRNPLVGPFLLVLWTALIASNLSSLTRRGIAIRVLMAGSLLAMFLLGHPVGEMFYWPMAAAAYVPTLAALCFIFSRLIARGSAEGNDRLLLGAALVVAASSSEIGAAFVACFAGIVLLAPLILGPSTTRWSRADALMVSPAFVLAVALLILYMLQPR